MSCPGGSIRWLVSAMVRTSTTTAFHNRTTGALVADL